MLKVYLSVEERDVVRAGAAAAGLTPSGFTARAALDAATVAAAPVGARIGLERLAGFQLELIAVRRQLALLRTEITELIATEGRTGPGELERRCAEVVEQLSRLSGTIHRQLGDGR